MLFPASPVRRRVAAPLVAALSLTLLVGGTVLAGNAARAALIEVPSTGAPGRLVLSSDPYPAQFLEISPGDPSHWQVAARLEGATSATLSLELREAGELVEHPRGLEMGVAECTVPWAGLNEAPVCAGTSVPVALVRPSDDGVTTRPRFVLRPLDASAPSYLLVTLAVADSDAARADATLMGLTGTMGVGLTAVAVEPAPVTPGAALPATGVDPTLWTAVATMAAGFLGLGAALRLRPTRGAR
ncbi:hypothetical protein ACFXQA_00190 [Microbacterium sp. P07]|uniref:hypothetical protein n=1 Tax=Microbacterium sp. P07 TaxID=3366952 RepID=UPI0037455F68